MIRGIGRAVAAVAFCAAMLPVTAGIARCTPNQTSSAPAFDVVSIKQNKLDTRGYIGPVPGQGGYIGFAGSSVRTKVLILMGFGISDWQISGGPQWVDSEPFDVDARTERPVKLSQINLMLQTLLRDRFHLQLRSETKDESVYELVVEQPSPNLVLHAEDGTPPAVRPSGEQGEVIFQNVPIARLLSVVKGDTEREVVDKTGLVGNYDFELRWESSRRKLGQEQREPSGPDIFGAVQRLGLRLRPAKGPVQHFFIEHIDPPTPN